VEIGLSKVEVGGEVIFAAVIVDMDERRRSTIGVGRDVAGRVLADERSRESEELHRRLVESLPVGLAISVEGQIVYINPAGARTLGYEDPQQLIGTPMLAPIHPGDVDSVLESVRLALDTGRVSAPVDVRCDALGGQQLVIGAQFARYQHQGRPATLFAFTNITERTQRERQLEAVTQMSRALRRAPTRAEMPAVILDETLDLFAAEAAILALRDPTTGETVFELGRGPAGSAYTGMRRPAGEGFAGQVIATGQPRFSHDVRADPVLDRPDLLPAGEWNGACVPLKTQVDTMGALWLLRAKAFDAGEIRLLTAIADMAASAVQRATLHELTEQRLHRLAALRAVDQAISGSLDLTLTLKVLVQHVVAQLHLDAAAVLLLDPHSETLHYAAGLGFKTDLFAQAKSRLGHPVSGLVALERRAMSQADFRGDELPPSLSRALAAESFSSFISLPLLAKGRVQGVLEVFHRAPFQPSADWLDFLDTLAGQAAIAIDNGRLFAESQRSNEQLTLAYDATIEGWSRALDLRDKETEGHTRRVAEMSLRLAGAIGMSDAELVHVRRGALLHDIGKMGVPDAVLLKPGPLSEDEWSLMRRHPTLALEMLTPIAYLRPALDIPYCHHEKWDGTGYPRGLKGEQIPLAARVFAVVDVWDALTSERPYRPAWVEDRALEYIRSLSGAHFDPLVVDAFLELQVSRHG
jgi:PAS domain S-box-containing protein/putative nucleotidyltransferase with HDIG domain